jgi:hypothetical protein
MRSKNRVRLKKSKKKAERNPKVILFSDLLSRYFESGKSQISGGKQNAQEHSPKLRGTFKRKRRDHFQYSIKLKS